jgi:predicted nucleic acid-binding protein
MLIDILLVLGTAALISWMVNADDEEVEEYNYDRTYRLTHYPDGRVEREEW